MNVSPNSHTARPQSERLIVSRLELYFATLTVLGAFVLAIGNDGALIPMVAIFFAIFGYVFVDVLKIIARPPTAGYIAMAIAAAVCIVDFTDVEPAGPRQLLAVAHLLVLVQAILMMQRKSKRIFEQLGIFCLLELIVAAVFNDAISFGLLLIPITVIAAAAFGLLSTVSAIRTDSDEAFLDTEETASEGDAIAVTASASTQAAADLANRLSKFSIAMFAPAIGIVAAVFFYALPRTTEATRISSRGSALVGFSDQVRLEQMGQMLQNPAIAMHVKLVDRTSGDSYRADGAIYIRGRVLEQYQAKQVGGNNTAVWNALPTIAGPDVGQLPPEFIARRVTDNNFYDAVDVSIDCDAMRSDSLFAIAPYHRLGSNRGLVHLNDRWTVQRPDSGDWIHPQVEYSFGTNAFHDGVQTELIARLANEKSDQASLKQYRDQLLAFNETKMSSIGAIASELSSKEGGQLSDYEVAKSIERHFLNSANYNYSLNLTADSIPGLDPIEQFISIDRQGHCQYFASAAAMMLRSQKIPARVVVGYLTDEYNEWMDQYVARQLHAHAWVEALIDKDQLVGNASVYGQPESDQYWLRLDPTPILDQNRQEPGQIRQSIDLAQDWWDQNVIEMDASQQQDSVISAALRPSGQWYGRAVNWLTGQIRRIRAGDLGGGRFAGRNFISWPAAFAAIGLVLAIVILPRIRLPKWARRKPDQDQNVVDQRPSIEFYATALDQLARVGIQRRPSQTPNEFADTAIVAIEKLGAPSIQDPMERLTTTFYRLRFGGPTTLEDRRHSEAIASDVRAIKTSVESTIRLQAGQAIPIEKEPTE